mmetsp:Transcript_6336/g.16201  ORF Transcript_6336/g.16201 Transcript_6336/m.16201 type:complete len:287 (+) Transcript_6336:913-1773(+)
MLLPCCGLHCMATMAQASSTPATARSPTKWRGCSRHSRMPACLALRSFAEACAHRPEGQIRVRVQRAICRRQRLCRLRQTCDRACAKARGAHRQASSCSSARPARGSRRSALLSRHHAHRSGCASRRTTSAARAASSRPNWWTSCSRLVRSPVCAPCLLIGATRHQPSVSASSTSHSGQPTLCACGLICARPSARGAWLRAWPTRRFHMAVEGPRSRAWRNSCAVRRRVNARDSPSFLSCARGRTLTPCLRVGVRRGWHPRRRCISSRAPSTHSTPVGMLSHAMIW